MKIAYKHLINFIPSKPSIDEISEKFFQLGHEHEVEDGIFNMELTPNRGDCLSLHGLLRDLSVFFEVNFGSDIYEGDIKKLNIGFVNKAPKACSHISFLKIDIEGEILEYKNELKDFFHDLNINKNNFFTDISNYISYERGQPTHCYDAKKIGDSFSLEIINEEKKFTTLLEKEIVLNGKNLVFIQDAEVINLAGIMGGKNTSCSINTKSVIIECAQFNPEEILNRSLTYNINSESAHKFERGVDPLCHENVLRRFIKIVSDHANIKNVAIYQDVSEDYCPLKISFDVNKINNILGINLDSNTIKEYLLKLGFEIQDKEIIVPSYRNDVKILNDIAEEVARVIGYNNISAKTFNIPSLISDFDSKIQEKYIKMSLVKNGFYEVINNPFVAKEKNYALKVDNPLDSNRDHIRTNLKTSLLENLLYNERRQQDSIKLFEISDIYYFDKGIKIKNVLGVICSGRAGKNFLDFSKKINIDFIKNIFKEFAPNLNIDPEIIDRKALNTKINNEIVYFEIDIDLLKVHMSKNPNNEKKYFKENNFIKYCPISEFPSSTRDLSFSIKDIDKYYEIQDYLLNYKSTLIKEIYIFDFYNNVKNKEIKLGFRFVFQSKKSTITESEVNDEMDTIINNALSFDSVSIPGLSK